MLLLVDYGKGLWSFVNELQQNSDTFSKEEYILGNILTVFVVDSSRLHNNKQQQQHHLISYIKYTNITLPANSKANRGRWLTFEAFCLLSVIHKQ